MEERVDRAARWRPSTWLTRGVAEIVLAMFFSNVAHGIVTAVASVYLATLGLGAAALGVMEEPRTSCPSREYRSDRHHGNFVERGLAPAARAWWDEVG